MVYSLTERLFLELGVRILVVRRIGMVGICALPSVLRELVLRSMGFSLCARLSPLGRLNSLVGGISLWDL